MNSTLVSSKSFIGSTCVQELLKNLLWNDRHRMSIMDVDGLVLKLHNFSSYYPEQQFITSPVGSGRSLNHRGWVKHIYSSRWWRHQMETISALMTFCAGNSPVPSQRPVTRGFDVFFDLRLNKCLSKQSWCCWFETPSLSLWRYRNEIRRHWFR